MKAPRFIADDGEAGHGSLPKDVVVALISVPEFRVKTLVPSGLDGGDTLRRSPSWALSWNLGV